MFEKNLINYVKTQKLGACPSCGGKVELTEMKVPNRVNLIVSCLKCNKKEMFLGTYDSSQKYKSPSALE